MIHKAFAVFKKEQVFRVGNTSQRCIFPKTHKQTFQPHLQQPVTIATTAKTLHPYQPLMCIAFPLSKSTTSHNPQPITRPPQNGKQKPRRHSNNIEPDPSSVACWARDRGQGPSTHSFTATPFRFPNGDIISKKKPRHDVCDTWARDESL